MSFWMDPNFWVGVLGNLVASLILGVVVWFWKLRPHFLKTADVHRWLLASDLPTPNPSVEPSAEPVQLRGGS